MKKLAFTIILIALLIGIYFYPSMPDKMASHWNQDDEVDGYMPKLWGLFLMPLISIILFGLFILFPKIDPLKKNYKKFQKYYDFFVFLLILFLLYIYSLSLFWNLGYSFKMSVMMVPALGLLFYYAGILLENAKQNWFVGIRTPWTLSSKKVWEKTHALGAKMFKASGLIAFLGIIFQEYALWFVLVPVLVTALFTIVYSYIQFKK